MKSIMRACSINPDIPKVRKFIEAFRCMMTATEGFLIEIMLLSIVEDELRNHRKIYIVCLYIIYPPRELIFELFLWY